MKRSVTARERRTIVLGAAVMATTWISFGVAPRWAALRGEYRDRLETVERETAAAAALLRNLPELVDSLSTRTESLKGRLSDFIVEASPEAASAQLASLVSQTAAVANVRLDAVSLEQDSSTRVDIRAVRANVSGSSDVRGLSSWLAVLEAGPPLVRIERLSLRQPLATAGQGTPEELGFEISFSALHLLHVREELP